MPSPIKRIQSALQTSNVDGWLFYDFRGLNPHAATVLDIPSDVFLTRRYFVWIPKNGQAIVLHNHIEGGAWQSITEDWNADLRAFGSHKELETVLADVVKDKHVAMEYSPNGAVPYVSRVDAGTLERVKAAGASQISTSADLLQSFLVWSEEDLAAHKRSVAVLMEAKDAAYQLMHERLKAGEAVTELEVQDLIMKRIEDAKMDPGHPVNVSFAANAADPHYEPGGDKNATLKMGDCVLIDLWAKEPGRPFGDVTWVGYAGEPSAEYMDAWNTALGARKASLNLLKTRFEAEGWGKLQGWELDRVGRDFMGKWEPYFLHRTGHDLGVTIHGSGANLDDYETHDTRTMTPGLGITIEPGIYPAEKGFGVRTEIDLYLDPKEGPIVTTESQEYPFVIGSGDWEEVMRKAKGG